MENPRPQLSLAELQQLRWLLGGLLGLLSAWTLFYLEVDALLPLLALTALVPLFILRPWLARALPRWVHFAAFPVIVTVFAADLWQNREPLPAMIRLDLMLLGYRCLTPRGRREDLQLVLLALFLVVVAGVFTVSPAFVVQILLFTGAALGLLLAVTLADSRAGGSAAAVTGWERVRWGDFFTRLRAAADLRLLGLGGALFAGVVGLSALLFFALPRFELNNDLFLDKLMTRSSRSGFSEDIRLGEVTSITQDNGEAFAVDVSDPATLPPDLYWRMLVLDEYTGGGFRLSPALKSTFETSGFARGVETRGARAPMRGDVWTIYYQPGVSAYLPTLGDYERLSFERATSIRHQGQLRVTALAGEPTKMTPYRVQAMNVLRLLPDESFARQRRAKLQVADPRRVDFLSLGPLGDPDRARLAAWSAVFGDPRGTGAEEFARRATSWLHERHRYSLESRIPNTGGDDVLVRWLASTEPGHCELFAGGLVLLARSAGLPARVVTGFRGGAWNEASGHVAVRHANAHAWVELWDEAARGWLRSDPTPGAALPDAGAGSGADDGVARLERDTGWEARLNGLRMFWYRRIVNFDQDSQVELLRDTKTRLQSVFKDTRERLDAALRAALDWLRRPWGLGRVLPLSFALLALVGFWVWWRRVGRARWLAWRSARASARHRVDPVRREATRWLARLAKAAAATATAATNAPAPELLALRAELLRLRFGPRETWPEPTAVFRRARAALRGARR